MGIRDRLDYVQRPYDFFSCRACGSLALNPLPLPEEVLGFYPTSYAARSPQATASRFGLLERLVWHWLFETVYGRGARSVVEHSRVRGGRLLEVGCSSGYQLRAFKDAGKFSVEGLDIDRSATDFARHVLALEVWQGTLLEAGLPNDTYDMVVLFNVLEHLLDPVVELREVARILRPGGRLALKVPNADSLQRRAFGRRWQIAREAPRHVLIPSKQGVATLLARAGLQHEASFAAPTLENAVSIALSIWPNATEHRARQRRRRSGLSWDRIIGLAAGVASIVPAFVECQLGRAGTLVHLANKPAGYSRAGAIKAMASISTP
jgi:SAM-dependent methyltransferase